MARKTIHSTGGFWLILGALLLAASLRLLFWAAVAAAVRAGARGSGAGPGRPGGQLSADGGWAR